MSKLKHPNLQLDYSDGDTLHFFGPVKTLAITLVIIAAVGVPTALVCLRIGEVRGVEIATARFEAAVDRSVREGQPLGFWRGDILLVETVKTDSRAFRGSVRAMARKYEDRVRYRFTEDEGPYEFRRFHVTSEWGPESDNRSVSVVEIGF